LTPREGHTATLLANGRVLIAGGNDTNGHAVASAELYDPKTGTFSPTGQMTTARGYHTATLLADGRVLIAGGNPGAWSYQGPMLDSADIYDPQTGTFKATGSMAGVRAFHAAALLADGRVLVTGGTDGTDDISRWIPAYPLISSPLQTRYSTARRNLWQGRSRPIRAPSQPPGAAGERRSAY
jgi:hypothetical protein